MRYAIVGWKGSGTTQDPYRPDVPVEGFAALDLRPDATVPEGFALVQLPERDLALPAAALDLGDNLDEAMPFRAATRLQNWLGVTLRANAGNLRDILKQLLISEADRPRRWKGLRPSGLAANVYECWMGGELVFRFATPSGGAVSTDSFNRADSTTLGSPWVETSGNLEISSNAVKLVAGNELAFNRARYGTNNGSADMYCQGDYTFSASGSFGNAGPMARLNASDGNFYQLTINQTNRNWRFRKSAGGVESDIYDSGAAGVVWAAGETATFRLECEGTTLRFKKNGTSVTGSPQTDTTITTGQQGGFEISYCGSRDDIYLDNYEQGSISASSTSSPTAGVASAVGTANSITQSNNFRTTYLSFYPPGPNTYYVDGSAGSDSTGNGSSGSPWATIQKAVDNASAAGGVILVKNGTYGAVDVQRNMSASAWLHIMNYDGHNPVIRSGVAARNYTSPTAGMQDAIGGQRGVVFHNCSYVGIYGFEIVGYDNPGYTQGDCVTCRENSHHVAVWKNYLHDGTHGCGCAGNQGGSINHIDVCYNRITSCGKYLPTAASGISLFEFWNVAGGNDAYGYSNYVVGNVCWNNYNDPSTAASDGNGIIIDDMRNTQSYGGPTGTEYTGQTLMMGNLTVDNGGRGCHIFASNYVHSVFNTVAHNLWAINDGNAAELSASLQSITGPCRVDYNIVCPSSTKPTWNGTIKWYDDYETKTTPTNNVFVRGYEPGWVVAYNTNRNTEGEAYFKNANDAMTDIDGWRPDGGSGIVQTVTLSAADYAAWSRWPDYFGYSRPSNRVWAVGFTEASVVTPTTAQANPGVASATGTANNATVTTTSKVGTANAGVAQGSGSAKNATASNVAPTVEIPYSGLEFDYDKVQVINEVRVSSPELKIDAVVSDTTSQAQYGVQSRSFQTAARSVADAESVAGYLIGKFKNPSLRSDTWVVNPQRKPQTWGTVLGLEIGDRVVVKRTPQHVGSEISRNLYVERIEHRITPESWTVTFGGVSAEPEASTVYWELDDGRLGADTRLFF